MSADIYFSFASMNDIKTIKNQTGPESLESQDAASMQRADSNEPVQVPEWLGSQLQHLFTDVMSEPMPDDLKALLKQLEDKERR
jgi:hypothetical protein